MWLEKSLHISVPISHFETLQLFYLLICVMNRTVIFQTYWNTIDAERCFWYQSARSGAGNCEPVAEWLLNAWSAEEKLLTLHCAHILWFGLSFWWHPFTVRRFIGELNFYKSVLMKKKSESTSWTAWGWVNLQQILITGWTIPLSNCPSSYVIHNAEL